MVASILLCASLGAQAFPPPAQRRKSGTRIGLFGFGVRAGVDANRGSQFVFGASLDLGDIGVSRVRLRPSADVGVGNGANTYAGSLELLYRFMDDQAEVIPYVGAGGAVAGHAGCGADAHCPALWINALLGIEIRYRSTFNWLVEYHPMDAFRHNRFYVGLTTRRGS